MCLPACLSVFVCLCLSVSFRLTAYLSVCLSVCLSVSVCLCLCGWRGGSPGSLVPWLPGWLVGADRVRARGTPPQPSKQYVHTRRQKHRQNRQTDQSNVRKATRAITCMTRKGTTHYNQSCKSGSRHFDNPILSQRQHTQRANIWKHIRTFLDATGTDPSTGVNSCTPSPDFQIVRT